MRINKLHTLLFAFLLSCLSPLTWAAPQHKIKSTTHHPIHTLDGYRDLYGLRPKILELGLHAYRCALSRGELNNPLLTIVDFTLPSYKKRMWIIDPVHHKIIYHLLVAHGSGSGMVYARHFSNKIDSHESSLGLFVTLNSYYGEHGYSMRLKGIEPRINNNAYVRDIVMHSAWYVNEKFVHENDRLGRSWGCFAINQDLVKQVINTLKGGSLIFAYAKSELHDPYIIHCPVRVSNKANGSNLLLDHSAFS